MAQPNALNPNFDRISFRNGSFVVTGGVFTSATLINNDVGSIGLAQGSLYLSSGGSGSIWMLVAKGAFPATPNVTWTQISVSGQ
jgi:hypothetical protein